MIIVIVGSYTNMFKRFSTHMYINNNIIQTIDLG